MSFFSQDSDSEEVSDVQEEEDCVSKGTRKEKEWQVWRMAERMRSEELKLQASREACFRSLQERCRKKERQLEKCKSKLLELSHRLKRERAACEASSRTKDEEHRREIERLQRLNGQLKDLLESRERDALKKEAKRALQVRKKEKEVENIVEDNARLNRDVKRLEAVVRQLEQEEVTRGEKISELRKENNEHNLLREAAFRKDCLIQQLQKKVDEMEAKYEDHASALPLPSNLHESCTLQPAHGTPPCGPDAFLSRQNPLVQQNQKLLATISIMRQQMEQMQQRTSDSAIGKDHHRELGEARQQLSVAASHSAILERDLMHARERLKEMSQELISLRVDRDKLLELSKTLHAQLRDAQFPECAAPVVAGLRCKSMTAASVARRPKGASQASASRLRVRNYNLKD